MGEQQASVLRRITAKRGTALQGGAAALAQPVAIMLGKVSRAVLGLAASASAIATGRSGLDGLPGLVPARRVAGGARTRGGALGAFRSRWRGRDGAVGIPADRFGWRRAPGRRARSPKSTPSCCANSSTRRWPVCARRCRTCRRRWYSPAISPICARCPMCCPTPRSIGCRRELSLGEGETHGTVLIALPAGELSGTPPPRPEQRIGPGMAQPVRGRGRGCAGHARCGALSLADAARPGRGAGARRCDRPAARGARHGVAGRSRRGAGAGRPVGPDPRPARDPDRPGGRIVAGMMPAVEAPWRMHPA
jgi:hypothetical protein